MEIAQLKLKLKSWGENLLLIIGGIVIAILILEVFAITTGFAINGYFEVTHKYFYEFLQPDARLGYRPQPNQRDFHYFWRVSSQDEAINTDSHGFRNLGRDYADSDLYFVGDSFTWGWGIDRENTFYGLLEAELNQPLITLGIPGYGLEQYQVLFHDWVSKYKPKTAILCIYANDLAKIKSPEEISKTYDTLGATEYETLDWYQKSLIHKFIIKKAGLNLLKMLFTGKKAENGLTLHSQRFMTSQFSGMSRDYLASADYIEVEGAFSQIINLAKENQVELLVFCIPTKESTYFEEYTQLFPDSSDYIRNEQAGYQQLCQFVQAKDVTCVDLTEAFRKKSSDEPLYFDVDCHWNVAGHKLAAQLVLDTLIQSQIYTPKKSNEPGAVAS